MLAASGKYDSARESSNSLSASAVGLRLLASSDLADSSNSTPRKRTFTILTTAKRQTTSKKISIFFRHEKG
jgi:hypothetical protein